MNVLLLGSGGREHALAWSLSASPLLTKLYCAPGNPGIAALAECVPIAANKADALIAFAKEKNIEFVIVGPEVPLVEGIADRFAEAGIKCLGPSGAAAVLEGSKGFVKDLCEEFDIPTARYRRFTDPAAAKDYAATLGFPVVIKADGLAAGKGVIIAEDKQASDAAIDEMFDGAFGEAGQEIVVEEFLEGEEASFFALTDSEHVLPLAGAQDHKRVFDGDKGPNTGGMGAYSPAPVLTDTVVEKVIERILKPTVKAMVKRGRPYVGVLFAGLMIKDGEPKLIEFNCRFGDPETQVLMLRLKSDLLTALIAAHDKVLDQIDLRWSDEAALTVVMATKGYPGDYAKGSVIEGLEEAGAVEGVQVFHAGTAAKDGKIVASGGRVLNITATGKTVAEAQARAYAALDKINWPEGFCRRDIGWRAIGRQ
ncbi:phosphoribosylamine--glycine ligase [Rhizomicrobium palustre]|uniref:Phosphoribosylamine--glycine ligase n=1 Tax=Rhizomicrobium palustre TaxID=189966 RepID=A0A846N1E7_9PROT|nr:phosphoribosylamine--glycine ligase [Rhizomicrobium palustre]NIK89309.1 phosphoribosylamine--glycine ligase [Rhizomicrobium palustre]